MDDRQEQLLRDIVGELSGIREGIQDLTTAFIAWLQASTMTDDTKSEVKTEDNTPPSMTARDLYAERMKKIKSP